MYRTYKSATQRKLHKRTESLAPKKYSYLLPAFALLLVFISCKKADITFGNALLDNSHTQIIKTDTVTIDASTVYIDSFVTNNKSVALTGVYRDPYFGVVRAETYLEVAPPAYEDSFQHCSFDSLEIVLFLKKNYYGDTAKPLPLNVYRLSENLAYTENSSMYNNSSFGVYSAPIGTQTFFLRPKHDDSIRIRLSDELGQAWLQMLEDGNSYVTDPETFRNYFKGFCIAPVGEDGVLFDFSDSVSVRLHYTRQEIYPVSKKVVFNIFNRGYQFNNISIDRTGTAISNISSSNNEISTTGTNNAGYMQYLTGTMVKLRFPYIRDVLRIQGYTALSGAELRIKPVNASFNSIFPLPPALRLATTDGNNQLLTNITSLDASNTETVQTGSLQVDELYGINTYYSYDVTDYIKYLIGLSQDNKYGLLIAPPAEDVASTFNRLLVQDNRNAAFRTELIIYYLSVQ